MEKLIITVALTGNVPTKEMNPHTPLTVDEIVQDIKACAQAGASVAHIHVRDSNLQPTSDRKLFKAVLEGVKREKIDIITQLSTGARGGENTVEWRGQMLDLPCEMASLSTGSSNFPNSINANTPELIKALADKMKAHEIKPEIEVFDLAMIGNAVRLAKKDVLLNPLHFNMVLNVPGSLEGTPKNLMTLVDNIPPKATWTVSAIGRSQFHLIPLAIAMGGHVRTGLEDVIEFPKGTLVSNVDLVTRAKKIADAMGREVATPDEARKLLSIK